MSHVNHIASIKWSIFFVKYNYSLNHLGYKIIYLFCFSLQKQFQIFKVGLINYKYLRLSMNYPFALMIPGRPIINNFEQLNGIFHIDVQNPKTIANIGVFLTEPIPEGYAIALYFSLPPYNEMQYLGAVANQKSSDIYSTGFPFKVEFDKCNTVKFCIQVQTFQDIAGLVRASDGQKEYAKLVAHNLYNFMMSYHNSAMIINNPQGKEYFAIPSQVFTKWMVKFDQKYNKDPNFILKTTLE